MNAKEDWNTLGRWKQPPLPGCFWPHCYEAQSGKEMIPGYEFTPLLFLDGYTLSPKRDEEWLNRFAEQVIGENKISELSGLFEGIARKYEARHLALLDATGISNVAYARELIDSYHEMTGIWWLFVVFPPALEKYALERAWAKDMTDMRDKVAPFERSTLLEDQAREITEFAQKIREQYPSVINLGKQIAKDMPLQSQIQAHVQKYDWFGTHHWMCEGYSYEKCIADIEAAIRENRHIEKKTESGDADAHADLWQLIAQSIYWRTHCAEITAKVVYRSRARLTEIAKSFGITYDDLLYLSAREILEQIEQDTFEFPHDFAERKNAYGCVVEGSTENIIVGNELHETIQRYVDFGDTDTTELKGSVASKGKTARGRARVMLAPEDFARFQTGDILIASETTPDFVPIMKKAAAIVTEVGGITSHAAVISRELGKPCIIGTKTATRVFPEGAMIEVDTERGIVRKI